ncbi:uncharacterized protein VP01_569g9 [Puccinia sorghi]|uniref:Uncharacterized protein n=1 Tax=Puccinia sorghi TaxID=27349 RepID=A0A0L6UIP4_9BASI|nr:uncharacterized protein VP01_569g9 [Puccinia sorghi]
MVSDQEKNAIFFVVVALMEENSGFYQNVTAQTALKCDCPYQLEPKKVEVVLLLVKEHFFVSWTSHFIHFRNLNILKFEYGHDLIELFICNSSRNLLLGISYVDNHQMNPVYKGIGKDSIKILKNTPHTLFCISKNISQKTIMKDPKQFKILDKKDSSGPYSQIFYKE